ncbi:MAG TPA: HD domain-containing phosphohydrolase [Longimicrobiaceae bacterium]|nr:HD domain-containing phosphohydrolase [Longimicrobiaceae bacterium]
MKHHSDPSTSPNELDRLLERAREHEHAGHWHVAISICQEVFQQSALRGEIDPLLESLVRLGFYNQADDNREVATEHLELALTIAELHGRDALAARALNTLGILKQREGSVAEAESTYLRALEIALRVGNKRVIGEIEQNLGTLANIRGDMAEAMKRYNAGLECMREAGYERGCAMVLNNLGMLRVDLGDLDNADAHFRSALAICEGIEDVVTAALVHANRAELFLARNEPERARTSCDEAFEINSRLGNELGKAEVLKFYGILYHTTGKLHLAESHLRQAISIAARLDPLLEAEALRELSLVLRAQQRNREALTALNQSHALFMRLQAQHDQADVNQRIVQLEEDFLSLVRGWGESIEAKDRYTSGHCQRVADYACRIAEKVGIPEHEITWFRMGAFLHDVGKTEVPAEILNKPGRLTDEERDTMERHTIIGDEILAPVEFPWDIRPMVRSHHERWDGKGYPDHLAGDAIPFTARILRIADIFDALTTARSYRQPLSPEEAFRIMEEDEGSFDPQLFTVFCSLFPQLAEQARTAHSQAKEETLAFRAMIRSP